MTNHLDPLEKRIITELPYQLDRAVRPFDAASIARVATAPARPSILRVTAAMAVLTIAVVAAVVAIEGLTATRNQHGSPGASESPASTPAASAQAAGLDQLASIQRADSIINTSLTAEENALLINAHGAVVEACMQELG